MACERTRSPHLLVAALVAVLAALWLPATGHAAERDTLASAGLLERGSGYATAGGSDAVRTLQRRLRRLGDEPGPIDGLYGPLTQGAVTRFQQRHGLAADGIVGRQTRRSLFDRSSQPTASPARHNTQPGPLTRKSPAPNIGSESAIEHPQARPVPADAASRDGPASGTSGVPPEAIAALAALALIVLFLTLRRQGEVRLNLGLTCAALLGVFGIGAVAGAVFATRAAPHGTDRATAESGLLLAGASLRAAAERTVSAWGHASRVKMPTEVAAAPARPPIPSARPSPSRSPQVSFADAPAPLAPVAPVAGPQPSAPPAKRAKPRIRVQTRLDGGATSATDSTSGGGARAGDPPVLESGGGGVKVGTEAGGP